MITSCFASLIRVPNKGRAIEASDRGSGNDLTPLLYISFLISSAWKAKEYDDTVEHSASVDVIYIWEITHIVLPKEILDLENGEVWFESLETGSPDSGVGD